MSHEHANSSHFDIAILGAGPAGLATACLLAHHHISAILIGPESTTSLDTRTSALFIGATNVLRTTGIWPKLCEKAIPIKKIRIIDQITRAENPSHIVFNPSEIGLDCFGHNIINSQLVGALEDEIKSWPDLVRVRAEATEFREIENGIEISYAAGLTCTARLLIAADGRGSPARTFSGITTKNWEYGQHAVTAWIKHSRPHDGISTEIHQPGGPLTTVPLAENCSAIVWLMKDLEAERLREVDDCEFTGILADKLATYFGEISLITKRIWFPIRGLTTSHLAKNRTLLVGESGHVLSPIGAQGLNLSLHDAAWAAHYAIKACNNGEDPGGTKVISGYKNQRKHQEISKRAATDLLNRSLLVEHAGIRAARDLGFTAIANISVLRKWLMREGIADKGTLPPLINQ